MYNQIEFTEVLPETGYAKANVITIKVPEELTSQIVVSHIHKEGTATRGALFLIPYPNYTLSVAAYEDGTSTVKKL